jgi:predicted enzyme related to lactoylglutathione lyase
MEKIKKVAFSVYPVKDIARSREFYEKTLGLKPCDDFDGKWQEYDIGGTTFAISDMITEFVKPGTQSAVSFEVGDLKSVCLDLKNKKVKFTMDEIMEAPVCSMQFILDPDGNTIGLHQCK